MNDLVVCMAATQYRGMMTSYCQQLTAADIEFHVEHLQSIPHNTGNLKLKIDGVRKLVDRFPDKTLVLSDSWDVRFYGTKEEVLAKVPARGVLMAAERNCWPDAYLADEFPNTGTPWRYVNGGLAIGTAESFAEWCDAVESHPFYFPEMVDQQWLNFMRIKQSPLVVLDGFATLFYCCVQEQGELEFRNGRPFNSLCRTFPNFLHLNGKYPSAPILMMEEASLMYHRVVAATEEAKCSNQAV